MIVSFRAFLIALSLFTVNIVRGQPVLPPIGSVPASDLATAATDVPAFEKKVAGTQVELDTQLRSVRATQSETRTALLPGLSEALERQAANLERLRVVLGQQVSSLRELANLELQFTQVSGRLTSLRTNGPLDPPPYSILKLDQLEAERALEVARSPPLQASAATSQRALEESERSLARVRQGLAAAEQALTENSDPTRLPTLRAEIQAAEAEVRVLAEGTRFRALDAFADHREQVVHRLRIEYVDEQLIWVRKDVTFQQTDLDQQLYREDKEAFDLQRSLDANRLEVAAAERRWTTLRNLVDGDLEPSDLQREELQTRFLELQSLQREGVLGEASLQRTREAKAMWQDRFKLATAPQEVEIVREITEQTRGRLEGLEREWQLQTSRLVELHREQTALRAQLENTPESGGRVRLVRALKERGAALERMVRAGSENLASVETRRNLARRLLGEARERLRAMTVGTWGTYLRMLGAEAWVQWIRPALGPLFKMFLLLFVCIPLNLGLSRRAQTTIGKLYSPQSGMIAAKLLYYGGLLFILFWFLNTIGVGLSTLVGAAGVTGVALGFASQTSVSNIISGIFLIAEQPFQVGDVITVGDITGAVLSIDLLSVKLRQFDNKFTRIPNETILKSNLTNISRHPIRRLEIDVSVAYRTDLAPVEALLLKLANEHTEVLSHPEPMVLFLKYGDSGVDVSLRAWVETENFLKVKNLLFCEIKRRFDEAEIEIPFPHVSLYRGTKTEPFEVRVVSNSLEAD